jgi:K+-sensing histidine kinase KdpD
LYAAYRRTLAYSQRQNNFLLSVTHELKSPLASIKLAFETIKKRTLKPEQNKMISENGIEEVDRLHNQVENILTATSIDQQYIVQLQHSNLYEILEEIKLRRSYRPDENRVTYKIVGEDTRNFKVDIHGCLLICDNLIGNALKYSKKVASLNLQVIKNKLIINVLDEGQGIEEKEKKNIFKRFYRIGNEETRRSKGTGLGLYIVNRIVEKNNGSIKVKNNTPQGTIFNVEIEIK